MFSKEILIYEKENSITTEICDDIIEMFENNMDLYYSKKDTIIPTNNTNTDLQMKYNEYIITNENNLTTIHYNIRFDDKYNKIKKTLSNELNRNIQKYFLQIKPTINISHKKNYNMKYELLSLNKTEYDYNIGSKQIEMSNDKSKTINTSLKNNIYYNKINILNQKIKYFHYIWFLNDYDTKLIFWNTYSIEIKRGKLIIFPISWCFPYSEILNLNKIYTIYGTIET